MPKVYNKRHKDVPKDAVYVGRPTKWGNPWSHLPNTTAKYKVATREEAVEKFREYAYNHVFTSDLFMADVRNELRGKDLVCWCAPKSCHADVLLEIANK